MLPYRLETIADAVPFHAKVADIGSDHGYLAISLLARGNPTPICTEILPGPYQQCQANLARAGLTIPVRLGDGLNPLAPGEVDWVIIAGMGGPTIIQILQDSLSELASYSVLVLQPMFGASRVRRFLEHHSLGIVNEWIIRERGQYYQTIQAVPRKIGLPPELASAYPNVDRSFLTAKGPRLLLGADQITHDYLNYRVTKLQQVLSKIPADNRRAESFQHELDNWKKVVRCHLQLITASR